MPIRLFCKWNGEEAQTEAERITQFLSKLIPQFEERRQHERVPCCRPVTLYFDDAPGPVPGLLRDISATGVGMILDFAVEPGEVTLRFSADSGCLCARVKILWCAEAARHYYLCGGSFISVFESDPIAELEG